MKRLPLVLAALFVFVPLAPARAQLVADIEARPLEQSRPAERELKTGETHAYTIALEAGQFLDAAVNQRGIDVAVRVFAPDGLKIAEIDSPNGMQGDEPILVEAATAGAYRIEVAPFGQEPQAGRYEIRTNGIFPAPSGRADGTLLDSRPCTANPIASYEAYLATVREDLRNEQAAAAREGITMPEVSPGRLASALETREQVALRLAYAGYECRTIAYASDGLVIAGYLWKPVDVSGGPFPLVIANRGGNRHFGPMEPWRHWGFFEFLEAGYVVLASQYRGGPGSQGRDEFGGADLRDVMALFPLARSLGYVDMDNVYMFGGSRGGMMTYMAARQHVPIRAFAIRAGAADPAAGVQERPIFEAMFRQLIPGYEADRDSALARRSAVRWADEIATPAILFHGTDDWRVDARESLAVADGLARAGTPFELHLYQGDTHTMTLNRLDMMRRMISFFERFRAGYHAVEETVP